MAAGGADSDGAAARVAPSRSDDSRPGFGPGRGNPPSPRAGDPAIPARAPALRPARGATGEPAAVGRGPGAGAALLSTRRSTWGTVGGGGRRRRCTETAAREARTSRRRRGPKAGASPPDGERGARWAGARRKADAAAALLDFFSRETVKTQDVPSPPALPRSPGDRQALGNTEGALRDRTPGEPCWRMAAANAAPAR